MDPINIIAGLNLIATFGANISGAKKGLRASISPSKEKPKTYLQKLPVIFATIILILFILGLFKIGTLNYKEEYMSLRITGLFLYLIFSWIQIWSFKTLGENYSQDVEIFKNHKLVTKGPFRFIRHPQYISQILMDIGAGLTTLSYIVLPLSLIQIPFIIMRASLEEKLLQKNFREEFNNYKNKSGFMIPFIG
jgi:protein-S-isoprenylcysteine O-methyltransferase Ste14